MTRILDKLREQDKRVKVRGTKAQAECPNHDSRSKASLSITGIEGQALVYDHGGCDTGAVLEALGLTMADLYDNRKGAEYGYDDGRKAHRTWDKQFWQSGNTNGAPTLYRLSRVEVAALAGQAIYLVEGEKDVHALESIGLTATMVATVMIAISGCRPASTQSERSRLGAPW